jgi:hypothetical protein
LNACRPDCRQLVAWLLHLHLEHSAHSVCWTRPRGFSAAASSLRLLHALCDTGLQTALVLVSGCHTGDGQVQHAAAAAHTSAWALPEASAPTHMAQLHCQPRTSPTRTALQPECRSLYPAHALSAIGAEHSHRLKASDMSAATQWRPCQQVYRTTWCKWPGHSVAADMLRWTESALLFPLWRAENEEAS